MGFFATTHSMEAHANLKVQSTKIFYKMTTAVACCKSNCFKGYRCCEIFVLFFFPLDPALTYMWEKPDYIPAELH